MSDDAPLALGARSYVRFLLAPWATTTPRSLRRRMTSRSVRGETLRVRAMSEVRELPFSSRYWYTSLSFSGISLQAGGCDSKGSAGCRRFVGERVVAVKHKVGAISHTLVLDTDVDICAEVSYAWDARCV